MDFNALLDEARFRAEQRAVNMAAAGCADDDFDSLFGSSKRNKEKSISKAQRFCNRIRRFDPTEIDELLSQLTVLDVSMYTTEIADALGQVPLKQRFVGSMVILCSALHADDKCFAGILRGVLLKSFNALSQEAMTTLIQQAKGHSDAFAAGDSDYGSELGPAVFIALLNSPTAGETVNRRKALLRLMVELFMVNVIPDRAAILSFIKGLCMTADDIEAQLEARRGLNSVEAAAVAKVMQAQAINILSSLLCRFVGVLIGKSRSFEAEKPNELVPCPAPADLQTTVSKYVAEFVKEAGRRLLTSLERALLVQEKANTQAKLYRGRISSEGASRHLGITNSRTLLEADLRSLEDCLHLDRIEADPIENESPVTRLLPVVETEPEEPQEVSPWESEQEATFHEVLPDLETCVSPAFLHPSREPKEKAKEEEEGELPTETPSRLTNYLTKLNSVLESDYTTSTKELDAVVLDFFLLGLNTKGNRRRLAAYLLGIRRIDLHFLPGAARLLAVMREHAPDVVNQVVDGTVAEFKALLPEKNQAKAEAKMKVCRMLSELCKFQLLPLGLAVDLLHELLDDFTDDHVIMACSILQSCGRFLYRTRGVSERLGMLIWRLKKLSKAHNVSVDVEILVEDALYRLKVVKDGRRVVEETALPPVHRYVWHLVLDKLLCDQDGEMVEAVQRELLLLDWSNPVDVRFVQRCLLSLDEHIHFDKLDIVAELIMRLSKSKNWFVVMVVDQFMEALQASLENPDPQEKPARFRLVKLLGELFNWGVISSRVLLNTLYYLIGFGEKTSYATSHYQTAHDLVAARKRMLEGQKAGKEDLGQKFPHVCAGEGVPDECNRVALVALLLSAVHDNKIVHKGLCAVQIDRFLLFFQRFVLVAQMSDDYDVNLQRQVETAMQQVRRKRRPFETLAQLDACIEQRLAFEGNLLNLVMEENTVELDVEDESTTGEDKPVDEEEVVAESEVDDEWVMGKCISRLPEEESSEDESSSSSEDLAALEFDRELKRITKESLENARLQNTTSRFQLRQLPTPLLVAKQLKYTESGDTGEQRIKLVTRRGPTTKMRVRELVVPPACPLLTEQCRKPPGNEEEHRQLKQYIFDVLERRDQEARDDLKNEILDNLYYGSQGTSSPSPPTHSQRRGRKRRR